jgi:hypothetical protein
MTGSPKAEYPALLAPGLHEMNPAQVQNLCVAAFGNSTTRGQIFQGLESLISQLMTLKISVDLWIDGSFVTKKPNPSDCDIVLHADGQMLDTLTPVQMRFIDMINNPASRVGFKLAHHCDCYVVPYFPIVDARYSFGESERLRWLSFFGGTRTSGQKGLALIKVVT